MSSILALATLLGVSPVSVILGIGVASLGLGYQIAYGKHEPSRDSDFGKSPIGFPDKTEVNVNLSEVDIWSLKRVLNK